MGTAPLTPPQARALQAAAPVVTQAWADIANVEEYILPTTWYARPSTEAAPATPTGMPPLPPDATDAAPALVVFTEASWPRVRFAPPLGPLVPTERPLVDPNLPLHWQQPGALQGDDDQDDEVEKDYPDVRLSRNSRLVPEGQRETKFCMLCHKPRMAERRSFCPKCLIQDTLIPMRHVIVRAINLCPLDFGDNPILTSDLMWNIAREMTRLTMINRNESVKLEPPDEPPILRRRVGIDPRTHELAFGDLVNVNSSYTSLQLQAPASSSGLQGPLTRPQTSVIATQTDTLRDDMSIIVDDDDEFEPDDDAFAPRIDAAATADQFTAHAVDIPSYRGLDDGIAVNDEDVDYGDASASDDNQPTLAETARARQATAMRVPLQGEPSPDVTDADDTTTYAATASQRSALQGVASELDVTVLPTTIPAYSGATPLTSGISPPTTAVATRTHDLSELPPTTPG